jgi:hypothetical protein
MRLSYMKTIEVMCKINEIEKRTMPLSEGNEKGSGSRGIRDSIRPRTLVTSALPAPEATPPAMELPYTMNIVSETCKMSEMRDRQCRCPLGWAHAGRETQFGRGGW